jgi:hypothetical protein
MKNIVFLILLVAFASQLQARDLFYDLLRGNDGNDGLSMQTPFQSPIRANAVRQAGDRVWSVGFNFKLLVGWDADDPYFGDAPTPAPQTTDVAIRLRNGQPLTSVQITKRKTNISHVLACTVDQSTTWSFETK